jgi:hypothetical protein
MGMIKTRHLPAPTCWRCEQRIGYNQRSTYTRDIGWGHEKCPMTGPPVGSGTGTPGRRREA